MKCCDADKDREVPMPHDPLRPHTDLLVNQPQRVLDVRVLEGDGRGGALEQLHEQAIQKPDWGEDHVAQLKRQDRPTRSACPLPFLQTHLRASPLPGMPSPHHVHSGNPSSILVPAGRSYKNQTHETYHCVTESLEKLHFP